MVWQRISGAVAGDSTGDDDDANADAVDNYCCSASIEFDNAFAFIILAPYDESRITDVVILMMSVPSLFLSQLKVL